MKLQAEQEGSATSVPVPVVTVGHSTRSLDELLDLLRRYGVRRVVDVRSMPRSRKNPQFNREHVPEPLRRAGIDYSHVAGLGGLRRRRADSVNTGWRNASFQGYADHMQTPEFDASLHAVLDLARGARVALMCAEAVPWRCHRSLIADALVVRGVPVEHIISPARVQPHRVTPWADVDGARIIYRPPAPPEAAAGSTAPPADPGERLERVDRAPAGLGSGVAREARPSRPPRAGPAAWPTGAPPIDRRDPGG
jgi:hypothetical protein